MKKSYNMRSRKSRARHVRALAKTTKGGKGRIKKRRAYKKYV